MRKAIEKKTSYLLALLMAIITAITVLVPNKVVAAEDVEQNTYKLELENTGTTEHKFEIYQIFKGDLADDEKGHTLSNIKWGTGISEDAKKTLGDASKKAESIKGEDKAKDFAEELQDKLSTEKKELTVDAGKKGIVNGLEPGYYLVKDKAKSQDNKKDGAYTLYILKVVGDAKARTKVGVPTVKKEVQENSTQVWGKAADYNIGDSVPFKLTGTLPSNYDKYDKYEYTFHDEMSDGLTFDSNSVKVTIDGKPVNESNYILGSNDNGFKLTFGNLKKIDGVTKESKIEVTYTAKLNKNAVIGPKGNENKVYLEYSNNPNKDGDGETGTTPEDKSIVFTYKVIVNKKDQDKNALQGAEFELYKKTDNGNEKIARFTIKDIMDANKSTFTFKGLDAGTYVLKETVTPKGYNTIKDVEFTITATIGEGKGDPTLNDLKANETTNLGILTFTPKKDDGSVSTDVINKKGFTLPETGGMGRTIIYGLGGVFVVIAIAYMGLANRKNQAA